MAAERDLELLDDYLANRLDENGRSAFEQKLDSDPSLKSELQLQQQLISGIKKVRVSELKGMLNNVPIPAGQTTGTAVATKIVTGIAVLGIVGTAAFFYFNKEEASAPAASPSQNEIQTKEEQKPDARTQGDVTNDAVNEVDEDSPVVSSQESSSETKPATPPAPVKKSA